MMGTLPSDRGSREQFERDAMRLLCSDLIAPETRGQLAGLLKAYVFADDLNRVVFEAIAGAGEVQARQLKELLPGLVTNLGFPDFELREYLGQRGSAEEDIDTLFESLLDLTELQTEEGKKAKGQSA